MVRVALKSAQVDRLKQQLREVLLENRQWLVSTSWVEKAALETVRNKKHGIEAAIVRYSAEIFNGCIYIYITYYNKKKMGLGFTFTFCLCMQNRMGIEWSNMGVSSSTNMEHVTHDRFFLESTCRWLMINDNVYDHVYACAKKKLGV